MRHLDATIQVERFHPSSFLLLPFSFSSYNHHVDLFVPLLGGNMTEHDPRYLEGIQLFNECEYFEAHDVWEELWQDYQGDSRKFYQGLIQVAVCLHHFGNGNIRGARKLYHSSRAYLEPYAPHHLDLNVDQLIAGLQECCAEILASTEEFPKIDIDPEKIPEIHLATEAS